jgi:hypothetical protein
MVKLWGCVAHIVGFFLKLTGKLMKKYAVLIFLALLTMTGALLEGFVEDLSPQLVQIIGLLTLISAGTLIVWALRFQQGSVVED